MSGIFAREVRENIKKYYSNPMCIQCDYDICKIYGGRCRKYRRKHRWYKFLNLFGGNKSKDDI